MEFLDRDPGDSPADALLHNADTIALYSKEPIWGITGSKDLEIGIVGFKDDTTKSKFMRCFNKDTFVDVSTRLNDLDEMLMLPPDIKAIHSGIANSYSR